MAANSKIRLSHRKKRNEELSRSGCPGRVRRSRRLRQEGRSPGSGPGSRRSSGPGSRSRARTGRSTGFRRFGSCRSRCCRSFRSRQRRRQGRCRRCCRSRCRWRFRRQVSCRTAFRRRATSLRRKAWHESPVPQGRGFFACPRPSDGAGQAGPAAAQGGVALSRRSSRCRCAGPPPRSGPAPSRWPRRARHGRGPGGCSGR